MFDFCLTSPSFSAISGGDTFVRAILGLCELGCQEHDCKLWISVARNDETLFMQRAQRLRKNLGPLPGLSRIASLLESRDSSAAELRAWNAE
jgi:hypothetical protein